jgi:carboxyl-terminal processing protease
VKPPKEAFLSYTGSMHQRTWLSLLTLPIVAAFSYPVAFQRAQPAPRVETAKSPQDPLSGLSDIQDVLTLVRDNYVDTPDLEKVIAGGIENALERAHPLNAYLTPEELRLPDPGPAQVGLQVLKKTIWAQVVAVTPGSPADRAGVQVGDVIRKLDGDSIGAMSAWQLERKLRGPLGSQLNLVNYDSVTGQLKKLALTREVVKRPGIALRKEPKATLVNLPDLTPGRAAELKALLTSLDREVPLVLDLRGCAGGELTEASQVAGLFTGNGPFLTVQEAGKPDRVLALTAAGSPAPSKLAILQGAGTLGAGEGLVAFLKKQSILTIGERTAGVGVERTRILLKQGGAVELVTRRWVGAGGEKLDRQGVAPETALKGLRADEDPLPKVLEILEAKLKKAA